jgi:hypothetical protein
VEVSTADRGGVLALMGSGETSPTMVTLHRELVAHLDQSPPGVILETPYGFQVNAADISHRARVYFKRSVGLETTVAVDPDLGALAATDLDPHRMLDLVRAAHWVFAGPGSPSYALARWNAVSLGEILTERIRRGRGVTVMASAAACTVGRAALPVYEIYKAGHAPCWLEGLDLLGELGLPVAVIPHYDNAEGGTHDTRYCYLGEPRLAALERDLPADCAVLGIDEHTAVLFDLTRAQVRVWGHGVMTIRRLGVSTLIPAGTALPLEQLRALVHGTATVEPAEQATAPAPRAPGASTDEGRATLQEAVASAEQRFNAALALADGAAMVEAILDLESTIAAWAGDTEEDQGTTWARTVLRAMIGRLGEPAGRGLVEPERTVRTLAPPIVELRRRLRAQGAYELADHLRGILTACGIELRDADGATQWLLTTDRLPTGQGEPPR